MLALDQFPGDAGAFRLYERAGMSPALGWVLYDKLLRPADRGGPQQL